MRYAGIIAGAAIAISTMTAAHCAKAEPSVERQGLSPSPYTSPVTAIGGERPRQCYGINWCGCYLADKLGLNSVRWNKNKAWEWARNLSPTSGPGIGVIVVWRHHVGQIVGQTERGWLVHSGNVHNRVHTGAMNLRGAVFRTL